MRWDINVLDRQRVKLESMTLVDGKAATKRWTQEAAREKVYRFAFKHLVVDFNDPILTRQYHKDFRTAEVAFATAELANVTNATTNAHLLIIHDRVTARYLS